MGRGGLYHIRRNRVALNEYLTENRGMIEELVQILGGLSTLFLGYDGKG